MHEYTETKSKYTGKIGTYSMYEKMYITLELKIMLRLLLLFIWLNNFEI